MDFCLHNLFRICYCYFIVFPIWWDGVEVITVLALNWNWNHGGGGTFSMTWTLHDGKVPDDITMSERQIIKLPLNVIEKCVSVTPILTFAFPLRPSSIQESLKELACIDLSCTQGHHRQLYFTGLLDLDQSSCFQSLTANLHIKFPSYQ